MINIILFNIEIEQEKLLLTLIFIEVSSWSTSSCLLRDLVHSQVWGCISHITVSHWLPYVNKYIVLAEPSIFLPYEHL